MFDDSRGFVTRAFLRAELDLEYRAYVGDGSDAVLLERLREWDRRLRLSEVQAEGAFTQTFFVDTWGYGEAGRVAADLHTIIPKLRILGEGAGGGSGEADLALGWFRGSLEETPQVLCEFKDIRSKLDARQNRKGSNRSPVEQCLSYLRGARRGLFGNEPVQPWWGIVTDMNEFRLYWWDRAPAEYLRFTIRREDLFSGTHDLLTDSGEARFDRFLFQKLFQRDFLLSQAGRPPLLRLIERQWVKERALEGEFYGHYKGVRERLFNVMRLNNPFFDGTPTELLRLSQALLDRFIFAFMKPLISGAEAKRYEEPETNTYLLFPYERNAGGAIKLLSERELRTRLPLALKHLRTWQTELRKREGGKFDDDKWFRFGRNQSIDKQDIRKLIVAQTVPEMRVCADYSATKYLNNVRVNGIIVPEGGDESFLMGVLNGTIADFVFRRIGKPKQGGWFEANKQFIAPLPIPNASATDRADIARRAKALQEAWTSRRDLLAAAEDRLSVLSRESKPARWLWPDLPELPDVIARAPAALKTTADRRDWAHAAIDALEATRLEALQAALGVGAKLEAVFRDGELQLTAGGTPVLSKIYLDDAAGTLARAHWRLTLLSRNWGDAKQLAAELRRPPAPVTSSAAKQFIDRVERLAEASRAIEEGEREMNERLFELYELTSDERLLVENGRR